MCKYIYIYICVNIYIYLHMYQNLHTVVKPQKIINHIVQVNLILKGNMMFSFLCLGC